MEDVLVGKDHGTSAVELVLARSFAHGATTYGAASSEPFVMSRHT